jgi:Fur family ferric uptake transcriptional regulator
MVKKEIEKNDFKNLLKKGGLKSTPIRLNILEIFSKNNKPINADFIFSKLKGITDEATVYRSLSSFEKCGILKRIDLRMSSIYFELSDINHHHHIVCTKCGEIEDFKESEIIERFLLKIVKDSRNFKNITEHSLELFGTCRVCN